ncbi:Uncharacterised protein [Vibrio cholerae]|uniref:Uncharacterized protein n=1 Tax=Vibrio cholerae TaxID=666 RepID=A0A655ZX18_VIBCL|nr:Uncharacterised protein [Vibrio cholerae]
MQQSIYDQSRTEISIGINMRLQCRMGRNIAGLVMVGIKYMGSRLQSSLQAKLIFSHGDIQYHQLITSRYRQSIE